MSLRRWKLALCAGSVIAVCTITLPSASPRRTDDLGPRLRGSWAAQTYLMKDGSRSMLNGPLFFTERDWTTLFFIQNGTELERGTGEGGTYTLDGNKLTLYHRYHLSAGKALPNVPETAPVKMEVLEPSAARAEPCTIELQADSLVIAFPSGNRIAFRRSSR